MTSEDDVAKILARKFGKKGPQSIENFRTEDDIFTYFCYFFEADGWYLQIHPDLQRISSFSTNIRIDQDFKYGWIEEYLGFMNYLIILLKGLS